MLSEDYTLPIPFKFGKGDFEKGVAVKILNEYGENPYAYLDEAGKKQLMAVEAAETRWRGAQAPAQLTAEQVAAVLNCQPGDVRILLAARLLKPLGNPPPNSVKFFATLELMEQVKDRTWLAKVTNAMNQHWQNKNAAKRDGGAFAAFVKAIRGCNGSIILLDKPLRAAQSRIAGDR